MRVPARFAIIVIAALSVLFAFGVDWLTRRAGRRFRPMILVACVGMGVADGWAVPIVTVPYRASGRPQDRAIASWLADRAPGALLHLPIRGDAHVLDYQFMTLVHGHPIVNGYSGYPTPLVELLGAGASPLYDVERFPAAVRMLRSLGVRYVFVHPGDYDETSRADGQADRTIRAFRDSRQVEKEAGLPEVTAFQLQPWDAAIDTAPVAPIDARELTATASEAADRLPNLFDRDRDSRWIAGIGGQDGSSWVRLQLARAADVARVELQIAERSIGRLSSPASHRGRGSGRTVAHFVRRRAVPRTGRRNRSGRTLPEHRHHAAAQRDGHALDPADRPVEDVLVDSRAPSLAV